MLKEIFNADYSPEYTKSLPVIIICLFIGVVAAAAVSLYHKHVLGSFIRFLRTSGACDEATAIPLDKTKFKNNVFVKAAINNGRTYACVLRSVLPEGAPDTEKMSRKEKRQTKKLGTSVVSALVGIVLFMLVAVVSLIVVPDLVQLFKNWTGLQ